MPFRFLVKTVESEQIKVYVNTNNVVHCLKSSNSKAGTLRLKISNRLTIHKRDNYKMSININEDN
ncbi:hypothetical protein T01_9978 [Trichinella spiralis]|uniref:Uncharacterized protein n=1 Tax=Trichinella spiralis TaxID=6334 RepID=A0A0V1BSW0_TRISP|nr:hypothetical protein T01_9978 [Trichinella spiralis]